LRQQGIIPSPTIVPKEIPLDSFKITLSAQGWFPEAIALDLGQHYPPGILIYAFVLQWDGVNTSTNLRVTNSNGNSVNLYAANTGENFDVYILWIFPAGAMTSVGRSTFCTLQRSRSDAQNNPQYDCAVLAVTSPLVLEVTPFFNAVNIEVTCSVYGLLPKHAKG
jgi:hypothetical protein